MAQLEERQAAALSSPSTPVIEAELRDIESDLESFVLSASLPTSPVRQQLVVTESEEHAHLVEAAETAVQSLDSFKRSYLGSMHKIWAKLPQTLISEGQSSSWKKVKNFEKSQRISHG